jgi:DNA-directed RNA polymerase specialized sigma24 family protein
MRTAARHAVIDLLRAGQREMPVPEFADTAIEDTMVGIGDVDDVEHLLRQAMPNSAAVQLIRLMAVEGETLTSAAKRLGINYRTAQRYRLTARRRIAEIYRSREEKDKVIRYLPDGGPLFPPGLPLLQKAARALPPRQREVFGCHIRGFTHAEIAAELQITLNAVTANLCYARKRLREDLKCSPAQLRELVQQWQLKVTDPAYASMGGA